MGIAQTKVNCPGCGATIEFKTTDSIVAVCSYCQTTVAKDSESINNFGIKSNILSDYSKIKIGTIGTYQNESFSVIGRVQIKYIYGFWNEWFILFSNGLSGWLSDANEELIITLEYKKENFDFLKKILGSNQAYSEIDFNINFSKMDIDKPYLINNTSFLSIDISTAKIIGAEGEIGFNLFNNQEMKVVDLRKDNIFLTIDYSESENNPIFYFGEVLTDKNLSLSNYKTIEEINSSNNDIKGKLTTFICPGCGTSNPKVNGKINRAYCISCNSQLDISEKTVKFLANGDSKERLYETTLKCGNIGTLNNKKYIVIGVILKQEIGEENKWVEYFLYEKNSKGIFLWLQEDQSNGKWSLSEDMTYWPKNSKNYELEYLNSNFKLINEGSYSGKVIGVWGIFNWEVNINDEVIITDYQTNKNGEILTISKEVMDGTPSVKSHLEVSFTLSKQISQKHILLGFHIDQANLISNNNLPLDINSNIYDIIKIYFNNFLWIFCLSLFFRSEFELSISLTGIIISGLVVIMMLTIGFFIEILIRKKLKME